jgi:hypothetical protein
VKVSAEPLVKLCEVWAKAPKTTWSLVTEHYRICMLAMLVTSEETVNRNVMRKLARRY